MSFPALSAALFFASAPLDMGLPPESPPFLTSFAANDQQGAAPVLVQAPPPEVKSETILPTPVEPKTETPDPSLEHGDIIVTSRPRNVPGDPLQDFNFASFKVTQAVDQAVVRPAALAYGRIVPLQIRLGIRNVLDHLTEPVVFVNFILQHKIGKAIETFGRFVVNTTIGVVGIFDIAKRKPFKLPHRPNGFADTMGFYGVKTGAFLYLPIIGPTTVRDLIGIGLDRLLVPLAVGKPLSSPIYIIPSTVFGQLDQRDQFEEKMQALQNDSAGYYTATREDYLQQRQAQIDYLRGKRAEPPLPPASKFEAK